MIALRIKVLPQSLGKISPHAVHKKAAITLQSVLFC
jgi:hypothetical protein